MDWLTLDTGRTESALAGFSFRCTYCNHIIPKPLAHADLGLASSESPSAAHIYPYTGCGCGNGRFVLAELRESSGAWQAPIPERRSAAPAALPSNPLREKVSNAEYATLPVTAVHPNPKQPRKFFDREALESLAESIVQVGLLEDILVRPVDDGFELVLGERRWRATQLAGLDHISAKVVPLTDEEVQRIAIVENVQRQDLSDVEEAFAYKRYIDDGMRQSDVASVMGKMGDRVAERLKTLSSQYYVEYQEQRITALTEETDRLRERLEGRNQRYDTHVIDRGALVEHLAQGYDLITTLDHDQFIVRRAL